MSSAPTEYQDLLIELGTEELPPKSLQSLSEAFAGEVLRQIDDAGLAHGALTVFAAPRRLAFRIEALQLAQPDRETERRGPAVAAAFDTDGQPTKAAQGFASSVGLRVDQLQTLDTDKGAWLVARVTEQGKQAQALLPEFLAQSVQRLPIPKRMRWGARTEQFVRPVHWLVALLGEDVLPLSLLGLEAGRQTHGHRFHAPAPLVLNTPKEYEQRLESEGFVIADFARRRAMVNEQATAAGTQAGGTAVIDDDLLNEVTALVEWPVALMGRFDVDFLRVPQEALITAMQEHQKYFPVVDDNGKLMNAFITISNIDSTDKTAVISGNEKVIRPRLADAAFFYDNDCRKTLAQHAEPLRQVVFQQQLGTTFEKCERVARLAGIIADKIGGDVALATQAGHLCKADLTSEMVGEFDTMQGVMGYYLARHEGLPEELAQALHEQYLPRFAGDTLPATRTGQAVALADKLDTLVGIFGIGQKPTGDKDPYALRRATLGILRIIIGNELPLDIARLVKEAAAGLGTRITDDAAGQALDFINGRYRAMYQELGIDTQVIRAVQAVAPTQPLDFDRRVRAVAAFRERPEAAALAAANKRVANILAKLEKAPGDEIDGALLDGPAEHALTDAVVNAYAQSEPLVEQGDYVAILALLADLREPVDAFFDQVMVMADDPAVRDNRLALLSFLRDLFLQVADISELGG
ncbi:glycine--tRNA ligase subunit beta [Alcanivorax sp. JB21]|uniref:glycine--tRNA ligase subunit beta n=1 Tax=Alcanivorax limicola TaxID=2874102 RepID=UPI001CC09E1B|nr:glycine--tRNA ligase subunit beta [Alcanivorax limicola]MBZ2188991.1 glycine--tRNA ligase subunit beta [Alcanivorax limicola]